jgi:hypothetical protein
MVLVLMEQHQVPEGLTFPRYTKILITVLRKQAVWHCALSLPSYELQIIPNITSMNNVLIVPIKKLYILCSDELPARDAAPALAARLGRACIRLLSEQVFARELKQHSKIVRVRVCVYTYGTIATAFT